MSKKAAAPTPTWSEWLDILATYRTERGHTNVDPFFTTADGKWLGGWLLGCRRAYAAGTLSVAHCADLRSFEVDLEQPLGGKDAAPPERRHRGPQVRRAGANWRHWLVDIAAYRKMYGHTDVSNQYVTPAGRFLGAWLTQVRRDYRAGTLPPELAEALAALDYDVTRLGRPPTHPHAKAEPWRPAGW